MKSIYSYALLGALFAVGAVNAATTTTIPVGYTTAPLVKGFNLVGVTLQSPLVATGTVTGVTATKVTASASSFSSLAAGTYVLEITSGTTTTGITAEVTVADATNLNTIDNLLAAGVASGTTFQLRKAATLEDLFGTTNTVLAKNLNSANADIVWVPTATPGLYTKYYLNGASAWTVVGGAAAPNTPIVYLDGVFVERKSATAVTLTFTGEVKKTPTSESLVKGFNLISTVYPVGVTLQNSGLSATLAKNLNSANADIVWVPTATPGLYTKYYLNGGGVWTVVGGAAAGADLPLTTGIFVERKAATAVTVTVTPPTSYASL